MPSKKIEKRQRAFASSIVLMTIQLCAKKNVKFGSRFNAANLSNIAIV